MEALRERLEGMTAKELREFARTPEGRDLHGLTGVQIVALSTKDALIEAMIGGVPEPPTNIKPTNGGNGNMDLAEIIAKAVQGHIQTPIDENTVNLLIDRRISGLKPAPKTIRIENVESGKIQDLGLQHYAFEKILKLAQMRMNIMLVGPAGSGKTTVCSAIAKALDLPFEPVSVCMQTTKSDLLGYMDANGKYVSTRLREMYEGGGVFLLDEIDGGNPNVLMIINAMAANGHGPFPDKTVPRHKDFILIAAANTYGFGGNVEYVGRNPIDAATRDRFAYVDFNYDEKLEKALCQNEAWCKRAHNIRKAIADLREKNVMATPRAVIFGGTLLSNGFDQCEVEDMLIFKGISAEIKSRVLARAGEVA